MINKFEQYKLNSIGTMTKGELLLTLYDEAIKKLTHAKILMENKDFNIARVNLKKCRDIFNHLLYTLNNDYDIAKELGDLYRFFNSELIKAEVQNSVEMIDGILPLVKELRDTWEKADKIAKSDVRVIQQETK